MNRNVKLALEGLEDRCVPSANSVTLQGGVLNILTDTRSDHTAVISQPTTGGVMVQLDNKQFQFTDAVTQIVYRGGDKKDNVQNSTAINATIDGSKGDDILVGGTANDTIDGGAGDNFIQDSGGTNVLKAGNGNNSVYGGSGNDTTLLGSGANVVYDLLGVNSIEVADHRASVVDYLFTNASSQVLGSRSTDTVVSFFAANRTPGAGNISLENGILYFTGNNNGNSFVFTTSGSKLIVTYDLNDGTGQQVVTFNKKDVHFLAGFGGSGNDTFINNTNIGVVAYGQSGDDVLIGGSKFNLLKGGAGNDYVEGNGTYNDLNGNGGNDILAALGKKGATNILRTDSGDQTINAGNHDVFIGPKV